jgi:hypothetical protein
VPAHPPTPAAPGTLLQECHLLSEEGWALLASLQHLQHLWVDACSGATPGVLTAVAACRWVDRTRLR